MEEIVNLYKKLESSIKEIDELTNIGLDVSNICISMLINLQEKHKEIAACKEYSSKIDNVIETIKTIKDNPSLKEKYKILYGESLVLVVSRFESFMSDLFRIMIDYYPRKITWPEKGKIGIEVSLLNYSNQTVGDLVVKALKGDISFQDLKSTLSFLANYLNIKKELLEEGEREKIIFSQATRHIIIHNNYKIDGAFLKQLSKTKFYDVLKDEIGKKISIDSDTYITSRKIFLKFADAIVKEILAKNETSVRPKDS